jgi:uncharacterized cupin superfamily protein
MSDVNALKIEEVDPYDGPRMIPGIRFRAVGRKLGVTAWGMNVLEIEAGCTAHPPHDHVQQGQEEVYVVLEGTGTIETADGKTPLSRGSVVRVGPATRRQILPGPQGITVLALGGTPGKAYPG